MREKNLPVKTDEPESDTEAKTKQKPSKEEIYQKLMKEYKDVIKRLE